MRCLWKNVSIFACIIVTVVYSFNPITVYSDQSPMLEKDEVYFAFFELPDGEATLIKTSHGENLLVNTGSAKSEDGLLMQLEELNIKRIDKLILTKQTIDYCGNANRLINRYNIEETYHAGKVSETCKKQLMETKLSKWRTGESHNIVPNLVFKILYAEKNGEMSLGIVYGENSIMYLSNSDIDDEKHLLKHKLQPKILKIGDYAKGKSPSEALLSKIDPHISIVFNCEDCVANEGLIERLNESWIDVYQLKQVGTTVIRMNLQDYEVLS